MTDADTIKLTCDIVDLIKLSKVTLAISERFGHGEDTTDGLSASLREACITVNRLHSSLQPPLGARDAPSNDLVAFGERLHVTASNLIEQLQAFLDQARSSKGRTSRGVRYIWMRQKLKNVLDEFSIHEKHLNTQVLVRLSERPTTLGIATDLHTELGEQVHDQQKALNSPSTATAGTGEVGVLRANGCENAPGRRDTSQVAINNFGSVNTQVAEQHNHGSVFFGTSYHYHATSSSIPFLDFSTERYDEAQKQKEEEAIRVLQQRVLASLYFPAINSRRGSVAEAHQTTFAWVFDEDTGQHPWDNLTAWLRDQKEHDAFWISGKPGSGKRTLMRYICTHDRFRALLKGSSGGSKESIVLDAYFWFAGSSLQKSITGFLRTCLYRLLQREPNLVVRGFDEHFREPEWTASGLMERFSLVVQAVVAKHKVLIVLDGLDECSDSTISIRETLSKLLGLPGVRLLASSRPLRAYEVFFKGFKTLRLQDLTQHDIRQYTVHKLYPRMAEDYGCGSRFEIADLVCGRAERVFLWVAVVVDSIIEGVEEAEDFQDLSRRITRLPTQLYDMFQSMLTKLDATHSSRATRYFHLVMAATHTFEQDWLSARELLLLELAAVDIGLSIGFASPAFLPRLQEVLPQVFNFIKTKCAHLIEADHEQDGQVVVRFVHRSAYEYLWARHADSERDSGRSFQNEYTMLSWASHTLEQHVNALGLYINRLRIETRDLGFPALSTYLPAWLIYMRHLSCESRPLIEQIMDADSALISSCGKRRPTSDCMEQPDCVDRLVLIVLLGLDRFLLFPFQRLMDPQRCTLIAFCLLRQKRSRMHCKLGPGCGSSCTQRPLNHDLALLLIQGATTKISETKARRAGEWYLPPSSYPLSGRHEERKMRKKLKMTSLSSVYFHEHFALSTSGGQPNSLFSHRPWPRHDLTAQCSDCGAAHKFVSIDERAEDLAEAIKLSAEHDENLRATTLTVEHALDECTGVSLVLDCNFTFYACLYATRYPHWIPLAKALVGIEPVEVATCSRVIFAKDDAYAIRSQGARARVISCAMDERLGQVDTLRSLVKCGSPLFNPTDEDLQVYRDIECLIRHYDVDARRLLQYFKYDMTSEQRIEAGYHDENMTDFPYGSTRWQLEIRLHRERDPFGDLERASTVEELCRLEEVDHVSNTGAAGGDDRKAGISEGSKNNPASDVDRGSQISNKAVHWVRQRPRRRRRR